jgi:membrane protein DedA with SNARE-associated domain
MNRYSKLYYHYLRRTGLFQFLGSNLLKLAGVIAVLAIGLFLMERYVITIKEVFEFVVTNVDTWSVFLIFTLSESLLGILPPDMFIVWSKELSSQIQIDAWLLVGFLATLSYVGGLISYLIGMKIIHAPKIHEWAMNKYGDLFSNLKKWGGFFVVVSALLPVPFSIVMMICGITGYPFKWAAYLGLFRFLRFFGYAIFLFTLV